MIGANPDGQHARAFLALACAHAPASAESISHLPRRALSGTSSIFPSFASQSLKSGGTGRCGSINMPEFTARQAGGDNGRCTNQGDPYKHPAIAVRIRAFLNRVATRSKREDSMNNTASAKR